jgi:hypothetical protein
MCFLRVGRTSSLAYLRGIQPLKSPGQLLIKTVDRSGKGEEFGRELLFATLAIQLKST